MRPARRHVVLAGGAALYLGAAATGWAADGWAGWAAIWGLLALWIVVMRPAADWSGPGAGGALRVLAALAVLAAVAGVVWGLGRLAAQVLVSPPVWAGPLLALAGLALARSVWSPAREAEWDAALSEALAGLSASAPQGETDHGPDPATLTPVADALDALPPDGCDPAAIAAVLDGPGRALPPLDMAGLLFRRAHAPGTPRDRLALTLGVTDLRVAAAALGQEDLDHAFDIIHQNGDARALDLLVARTETLLAVHPASWRDMPQPLSLFMIARKMADAPATAAGLCRLARRVRALGFRHV